jgi:hypothetical protein
MKFQRQDGDEYRRVFCQAAFLLVFWIDAVIKRKKYMKRQNHLHHGFIMDRFCPFVLKYNGDFDTWWKK